MFLNLFGNYFGNYFHDTRAWYFFKCCPNFFFRKGQTFLSVYVATFLMIQFVFIRRFVYFFVWHFSVSQESLKRKNVQTEAAKARIGEMEASLTLKVCRHLSYLLILIVWMIYWDYFSLINPWLCDNCLKAHMFVNQYYIWGFTFFFVHLSGCCNGWAETFFGKRKKPQQG